MYIYMKIKTERREGGGEIERRMGWMREDGMNEGG